MYSYSDFFAEKKFPTFCKGCHHSIGFVSVFCRRMNDCLVAPSLSVKHDCHVTPSLWNMIAPLPHLCETRYSRCPISVKQDCHFAPSVWNRIVTLPLLCETGLSLCPFSVKHNCPFAPSLWNRIVALPHLCETGLSRYPISVKHESCVTVSVWNMIVALLHLCETLPRYPDTCAGFSSMHALSFHKSDCKLVPIFHVIQCFLSS